MDEFFPRSSVDIDAIVRVEEPESCCFTLFSFSLDRIRTDTNGYSGIEHSLYRSHAWARDEYVQLSHAPDRASVLWVMQPLEAPTFFLQCEHGSYGEVPDMYIRAPSMFGSRERLINLVFPLLPRVLSERRRCMPSVPRRRCTLTGRKRVISASAQAVTGRGSCG